jgi:hypothetical protein
MRNIPEAIGVTFLVLGISTLRLFVASFPFLSFTFIVTV